LAAVALPQGGCDSGAQCTERSATVTLTGRILPPAGVGPPYVLSVYEDTSLRCTGSGDAATGRTPGDRVGGVTLSGGDTFAVTVTVTGVGALPDLDVLVHADADGDGECGPGEASGAWGVPPQDRGLEIPLQPGPCPARL
jgi:hypothetical protein